MDTHTYPGRGLSVSQLIFAFNEELKRVAYSPLFTLEAVSQLDRDGSTALASIREWRNSFVRVNCIPIDILSLIPTHLTSQKDHFHAASVCRHWRGVLLNQSAIWSQMFLKKGEECVSTLLERAKGSALDVVAHRDDPVGTITLISPRAQQIRHLEFRYNRWQDIVTFSAFNPPLRTLKIIHPDNKYSDGQPVGVAPPSYTLFSGSINLEQFVFHTWMLSLLNQFSFPNLTTFELFSVPGGGYSALYLLDFLKASPTLQLVKVKISADILMQDVPQEMVVVLPNAETFSLCVLDLPTTRVYDIGAQISCPCAKQMVLTCEIVDRDMSLFLEMFPTPVLWDKIVHQHMTNLIEEVTLEIDDSDDNIGSLLTFRTSDATTFRLGFDVAETDADRDVIKIPRAEKSWEIFSQALTTIRDHPLISHIKRLRIKYRAAAPHTFGMLAVVDKVRDLFHSLGPLDELTICGCDLHVFLATFLDDPVFHDMEQPIVFPSIRELVILHPVMDVDEMECMDAIKELAFSQYTLGVPFECVMVRMWSLPDGMAEELGQWVTIVDCCQEEYTEE
ncbi:hypothetical protein BJ322DRAFT_1211778 [Thelephora terrestris]|uniref:F-box domain-containing protein n=1 Tax=Thelephora terrestris TaxID=56493 RepID=A0A9P6L5S9_9AGAM|nr:hypothetical protein BJ322DRAFT_1211778 [Thelephora terrestris]